MVFLRVPLLVGDAADLFQDGQVMAHRLHRQFLLFQAEILIVTDELLVELSEGILNITYLARHTFATTITLAKGVPIETVSKMLGHTNIQTTQIYARITNSKISNDMEDLAGKLGNVESVYNKAE